MAILIVLPFTPPFSTCDAEPVIATLGFAVHNVATAVAPNEIVMTEAPPDAAVRPSVIMDDDHHDGTMVRVPTMSLVVVGAHVTRVVLPDDAVPHAAPLALRV